MSFFSAPQPPREEPPRMPEHKAWHGPPLRTLPGRLSETLVLAHTDRVAVAVTALAAYPTGFTFDLETVPRRYDPREWAGLDHFGFHHGIGTHGEIPPELLRFGVEFADGGRATSLDAPTRGHQPETAPTPPVLSARGGGGGGGRSRHDTWVWPLPPPGPLAFVCEWPALDIALTRIEIDAEALHRAATRSRLLWHGPGDAPPGGGRGAAC
jgi:hypothetical protein